MARLWLSGRGCLSRNPVGCEDDMVSIGRLESGKLVRDDRKAVFVVVVSCISFLSGAIKHYGVSAFIWFPCYLR